MLLALCLIGLALANLNEWKLLVDGQQEWFCGACAVPDNWTLIQPSLIVSSQWPLNFTLLPTFSIEGNVSLILFYRLRYCNLSAHWVSSTLAYPLELKTNNQEWMSTSLLVPGIHSETSKLELLTDNCVMMLANITYRIDDSFDSNSSSSSSTSSDDSTNAHSSRVSDIVLWFLLAVAITFIAVGCLLIGNFIRIRLSYQTLEMASLEAR